MKATAVRVGTSNGTPRFDAGFHLSDGVRARQILLRSPYPRVSVGSVTKDIFNWTRGRRTYVFDRNRGTPFLGGATMLKSDLSDVKFISNLYTPDLNASILKRDWTLISCSGTIGKTVYSTRIHEGMAASQHVMRVVANERISNGMLYAFFASRIGYALLTQGSYGSVIDELSPSYIKSLQIPVFPDPFQRNVHEKIMESARLREEADAEEKIATQKLFDYSKLRKLTSEDYNYFGPRSFKRKISSFSMRFSAMTRLSINAFNYSERMRKTVDYVRSTCETIPLSAALLGGGFFSTGSFPRLELDSPKSLLLINQSDIFNARLTGKKIARRGVKAKSLVEYGEVIIAGVGTLGESESFCRVVFANESLVGQLISGEFIRMKTNEKIPSGYLYAWLHSDYGFRMIRSTQAGTKLCRPIQKLLLQMPVPVLRKSQMSEINQIVLAAQTKRAKAARLENEAIDIVEREIESWQEEGR